MCPFSLGKLSSCLWIIQIESWDTDFSIFCQEINTGNFMPWCSDQKTPLIKEIQGPKGQVSLPAEYPRRLFPAFQWIKKKLKNHFFVLKYLFDLIILSPQKFLEHYFGKRCCFKSSLRLLWVANLQTNASCLRRDVQHIYMMIWAAPKRHDQPWQNGHNTGNGFASPIPGGSTFFEWMGDLSGLNFKAG